MTNQQERTLKDSDYLFSDLVSLTNNIRDVDKLKLIKIFDNVYKYNIEYAIKWLFYISDIRNGLGERQAFKNIFEHLATKLNDMIAVDLVKYIPIYTRWDVLTDIVSNIKYPKSVRESAGNVVVTQLEKDKVNMQAKQPISLLAKWLPSSNTSNKDVRAKAYEIRKVLSNISESDYRKMLSKMRRYINDNIEQMNLMDKGDWDKLNANNIVIAVTDISYEEEGKDNTGTSLMLIPKLVSERYSILNPVINKYK